jgi:hypothetical protein
MSTNELGKSYLQRPQWIRNMMPNMSSRDKASTIQVFRSSAASGDLQFLKRAFGAGGLFKRLGQHSRLDINDRNFLTGTTALMDAAAAGHQNIVEYLLAKKADVGIRDCKGRTALHYSVCAEIHLRNALSVHNPLVHALVIGGVDIDATDWDGVTALDLAYAANNVSAAFTLSCVGARQKPAHKANNLRQASTTSKSTMGNAELIENLFESIRDLDMESDDGETYGLILDGPELTFLVGEFSLQMDWHPKNNFEAETVELCEASAKHCPKKAKARRPLRRR